MRIKHLLTVTSMILMLGFGTGLMAQKSRAAGDGIRAGWTENRPGARLFFMDEDGDGICDHFQDHDGDGIPNGRDEDWERPKDGSGNQKRLRKQNQDAFANRNSFREQNGDGQYSRSFRYRRNQGGNTGNNGTGPKGNGPGGGGK